MYVYSVSGKAQKCLDIDFKPNLTLSSVPEPVVYFTAFHYSGWIMFFEVRFMSSPLSTSTYRELTSYNPSFGQYLGFTRFSRFAFLGKYFVLDSTLTQLTCFSVVPNSGSKFTFITSVPFSGSPEAEACLTYSFWGGNKYVNTTNTWLAWANSAFNILTPSSQAEDSVTKIVVAKTSVPITNILTVPIAKDNCLLMTQDRYSKTREIELEIQLSYHFLLPYEIYFDYD